MQVGSRRDYLVWSLLAAAFLAGLFVRLWPVLAADFPLNDGGMFYVMAQEIRAAHYHLPVFTAYNDARIPFAYPPLGFYVAAALSGGTGAGVLQVLRFLPAIVSALTAFAYYAFSRQVLGSRSQALMGCFAFTLLPRTYGWMVMGGGLTRAPGFAFAILALWQAYVLYTRDTRGRSRTLLTTAVLASLTALTHAEMAWFLAYSMCLLWLFYGRSMASLLSSFGVAAIAAVLTAPWWGVVLLRHGVAPFEAAAHTGGQRWFTWHPSYITGEPFWPILGFIGLAGLGYCCWQRRFYLPVWTVAIFIVQPRSARTLAMIPITMAVGLALDRLILPALYRWSGGHTTQQSADVSPESEKQDTEPPSWLAPLAVAFLTCLFLYALCAAWLTDVTAPPLKVLPTTERAAMQWVSTNTPVGSRFLILTADGLWDDRTLEWFPALAGRASVTTIQGSEWLPQRRFYRLWDQADKLAACSAASPADATTAPMAHVKGLPCVQQWAQQWSVTWTHVYVRKEPEPKQARYWQSVRQALYASPLCRVVYDGPGATIFAWKKAGLS